MPAPSAPDREELDRGLDQLAELLPESAQQIGALESMIVSAADHELFRINPTDFARAAGIEVAAAVPLLLAACRAGILRMEWALVCRGCGEIAEGHTSLQDLEPHFDCLACSSRRDLTLDESVQVGFTVSRSVRQLSFHDPGALDLEDYFLRYKFSTEVLLRGTTRRLTEMISDQRQVLARIEPGEEHVVNLDLEAGWLVGSPRAMITISPDAPPTSGAEIRIELRDTAYEPRPVVAPGPLRLRLVNATDRPQPTLLYFTPEVTYFDYRPFLSGRDLLNNPSFRRQLHTQVVRPGSGLRVVDNTILFVDFVGSTALYDTVGDAAAFDVVSAHLEALGRLVTRFGGTVVKTIGDAVMASFSHPVDGVGAALHVRETLAAAPDLGADPLPTRVGVHRGPCVAVNVGGNIDYFGQTVNIASRVEGIAAADEICITDEAHADPAVQALLGDRPAVRESASLKGVGSSCGLYRIRSD